MAPKEKKSASRAGVPQLGIRVDAETLKRLDALRDLPSIPGVEISRADIARAAILAGLDVLEKRGSRGK
jgi:hypothetical protein